MFRTLKYKTPIIRELGKGFYNKVKKAVLRVLEENDFICFTSTYELSFWLDLDANDRRVYEGIEKLENEGLIVSFVTDESVYLKLNKS